MSRIRDYLQFLLWKAGLSYIALWVVVFVTLDHGHAVLGGAGGCVPDEAKVLFYWVCDPASPYSILAGIANTALTATVWAPVYVAAATVRPELIVLALPIVTTHVVGLPAALLIAIRTMLAVLALPRRLRKPPPQPHTGPDLARIAAALNRNRTLPDRPAFGMRKAA